MWHVVIGKGRFLSPIWGVGKGSSIFVLIRGIVIWRDCIVPSSFLMHSWGWQDRVVFIFQVAGLLSIGRVSLPLLALVLFLSTYSFPPILSSSVRTLHLFALHIHVFWLLIYWMTWWRFLSFVTFWLYDSNSVSAVFEYFTEQESLSRFVRFDLWLGLSLVYFSIGYVPRVDVTRRFLVRPKLCNRFNTFLEYVCNTYFVTAGLNLCIAFGKILARLFGRWLAHK